MELIELDNRINESTSKYDEKDQFKRQSFVCFNLFVVEGGKIHVQYASNGQKNQTMKFGQFAQILNKEVERSLDCHLLQGKETNGGNCLSLSLSLSLSPMSNETQQKARRSDSFDSSNRSVLTSLSLSLIPTSIVVRTETMLKREPTRIKFKDSDVAELDEVEREMKLSEQLKSKTMKEDKVGSSSSVWTPAPFSNDASPIAGPRSNRRMRIGYEPQDH